jgi:hypothetical protein
MNNISLLWSCVVFFNITFLFVFHSSGAKNFSALVILRSKTKPFSAGTTT